MNKQEGTIQLNSAEDIYHVEIDGKEVQLRTEQHISYNRVSEKFSAYITVYIYWIEGYEVDEGDETEVETDAKYDFSDDDEKIKQHEDGDSFNFTISIDEIRKEIPLWIEIYEQTYNEEENYY